MSKNLGIIGIFSEKNHENYEARKPGTHKKQVVL